MLEDKFRNLQERTEIIILPEMFSHRLTMSPELLAESMDGETIRWMKEMAAKHRVILTGSVIIEEDNKFYNRLIWMLPNGLYGYYDKRHRFGFAGEEPALHCGEQKNDCICKRLENKLRFVMIFVFPYGQDSNHHSCRTMSAK
jgi:predicted amidohydrolase